jgi:hypothetical protein
MRSEADEFHFRRWPRRAGAQGRTSRPGRAGWASQARPPASPLPRGRKGAQAVDQRRLRWLTSTWLRAAIARTS